MSTKIYNGYRLGGDLNGAWKKSLFAKKRLQLEIVDILHQYHVNNIVKMLDEVSLCGNLCFEDWAGHDSNLIAVSQFQLMSEHNKLRSDSYRNPDADFNIEWVLLPYGEYVYMLVYSEQQRLINCWSDSMGVEEYNYWDNEDKPDNITGQQWNKRGETWDNILDNYPPADRGLTCTIFSDYSMPFIIDMDIFENMFTKNQKPKSDRIKKFITPLACQYYGNNVKNGDKELKNLDLSGFLHWMDCVGGEIKQQIIDYLDKTLPNTYSIDDCKKSFKIVSERDLSHLKFIKTAEK